MKKLKTALILLIVIGAIGFIAGALIAMFTSEDELSFAQSLTSSSAFIGLGIGAALGFIIGIFPKKAANTYKNVGTTAEGKETDINFDSKFITPERLRNDPELIATTWNALPSLTKTGFVFRNKEMGGRYEINMKPETHALVLGTTGVGKTQIFANPTVRILAHSAQKPSLIMTDPKGELYTDNANILKNKSSIFVVYMLLI